MATDFSVRLARPEDRASVLELIPRLRAFGTVPLRSPEALDAGERRTLKRYFETPMEGAKLWVAELGTEEIAGVAYAERSTDYFTQESHGHLGILLVAASAEGLGIGRALMRTVERWARDHGFRFLTLNVFAGNEKAREFYEKSSFQPDTMRYIKAIDADS